MDLETFQNYCLSKKGTELNMPFDDNVLAFRVMGKIFCLSGLDTWEHDAPACNLKCDPDKAIELRSRYEAVKPGYHMNKKHWNTISINKDLPDSDLKPLIDHSYELVVNSLTKKMKSLLENL